MKLFVVGFALLAAACVLAEVPSTDYLPPSREISAPRVSGISGELADDGYRYKTVRRLRVRRRRSVDELQPSVEYLSPVDQIAVEGPTSDYYAPIGQEAQFASGLLNDDGYRYKTVKRFRSRHRRSVNEIPAAEYLAPVDQIAVEGPTNEFFAPIGQEAQFASGLLNDDGYRYKTVKRFRSRHRRSVNEIPAAEYLAPVDQIAVEGPTNEFFGPIGQEAQFASGLLNDDGYRYKTVKRFRSRHRRSVNEIPAAEYLAPVDQIAVEGPTNEFFGPIGQEAQFASGLLNDDGYRYKTVKRFRSRHRRSVNEIPASEYLAPVQQIAIEGPTNEFFGPIGQEAQFASGLLNDDGYRYKTVKRFRSRHRRSVNEIPASEYLAPVQQIAIEGPSNEYLAPIAQEAQFASGLLNDDGYRYKTVKRFRSRH